MELKNIIIIAVFVTAAVVLSKRAERAESVAVAEVSVAPAPRAPTGDFLVSLTRAQDDEFLQAGFSLSEPLRVRVYGLGEGSGGTMFDYGWIADADTRETVWQMEYATTSHAGGAQKNRLQDQVIELEPGNYLAHYVTDGSHSFDDWNSASPPRGDLWGLTIVPVGGTVPEGVVSPYEPSQDENVVAAIAMVRDGEDREVAFSLDEETTVRVTALGEGSGGSMHDYGWISDAYTGQRVWSMDYDQTEWAGGARKNRMISEEIVLPAGRYALQYRTDGSHSFGDWNSAPPPDPSAWGISVRLVP